VSALTISRSAAILLSEKCSTESDISRIGRTARDPRWHLRWWLRLRRRSDVRRRPVPERPPRADVPRVECAEHGVSQAATPWAKPDSRFTALLEAVVIDRPNGAAESTNARIQRIKRLVWGEPAPRALRERDPVPSPQAGSPPEAGLNPHDCLKRLFLHRVPLRRCREGFAIHGQMILTEARRTRRGLWKPTTSSVFSVSP